MESINQLFRFADGITRLTEGVKKERGKLDGAAGFQLFSEKQ